LEELIAREHPEVQIEEALLERETAVDPYQIFRLLLLPLESVKQNPKWHPEGDVLYHSLQVFERARDARPWDEEFLVAALLHDVGKGLDPYDHVAAGLQALDGLLTPRTAWLIENHMLAQEYKAGTLGHRQRLRLEQHEDFDDLMELREADDQGRVRATFTDPGNIGNPNPESVSEYDATVNWGDGSIDNTTDSPSPNIFVIQPDPHKNLYFVEGSHTYIEESTGAGYLITTTIHHRSEVPPDPVIRR